LLALRSPADAAERQLLLMLSALRHIIRLARVLALPLMRAARQPLLIYGAVRLRPPVRLL